MPEIQATVNIENEIRNVFNPLVYSSLPQNNFTKKLQLEIIKTHYQLIEANKRLYETIIISERVCKAQGSC
jgi:hypothetical protein